MAVVHVVSHPEVIVDPAVPIERWGLAPAGIARMRAFAAGFGQAPAAVFASTETKAIEAAGIFAARFGLGVAVHAGLGENDRSATGFLPPDDFERTADAFFKDPQASVRGWERAADAAERIAAAVAAVCDDAPTGDVVLVTHGAVGTLLFCRMAALAVDRRHDQPFQGHVWRFERDTGRVLHPWKPIAPR